MRNRFFTLALTLALALSAGMLSVPRAAEAHQPFCEFADLTFDTPHQIEDHAVSLAFYANMYPANDVDYYTFEAEAGDEIYLQMTVPSIDGQDVSYVPMLAAFGPGLDGDAAEIPARVAAPVGYGALVVPVVDEPVEFWEPFGRQYYWQWQDMTFAAPQTGTYTVAVWHPTEEIGRYVFVIGKKEIFGGELDCFTAMGDYFTPLVAGESPYRDTVVMTADHDHADHDHADGTDHDHSEMIDLAGSAAIPVVDLQVIPLGNGDYNLRVQTLNFEFAPQNVNGEHIPGQGHAHLYIDGEKITRIYGEWYYLESVPDSAQMITVGLYANDHRTLAVDGEPITASALLPDGSMTSMDGDHADHGN